MNVGVTTFGGPPLAARPAAVSVRGVSRVYGQLVAVDDLTLDIPTGCTFGLIGPNGAGKTTTFAMMAGLVRPSSGQLEVAGFDPATDNVEVRRRVGFMPDSLGLYENLTVDEYLGFFARAYGVRREAIGRLVSSLLERVELEVRRADMVDSLSRGMKQRLSLARAMVHDPDVLILDEPASGLDPRARIDLRRLLRQLEAMGKTLVISSHILAELEEMCSAVGILQHGRLLASGTPADILGALGGSRKVRITLAGGYVEDHEVASEAEQVRLLRRLVIDEGRPVIGVEVVDHGLEQVFLRLTESPRGAE